MTKAIYAFSGDPITLGHVDIVKRLWQMGKVLHDLECIIISKRQFNERPRLKIGGVHFFLELGNRCRFKKQLKKGAVYYEARLDCLRIVAGEHIWKFRIDDDRYLIALSGKRIVGLGQSGQRATLPTHHNYTLCFWHQMMKESV